MRMQTCQKLLRNLSKTSQICDEFGVVKMMMPESICLDQKLVNGLVTNLSKTSHILVQNITCQNDEFMTS